LVTVKIGITYKDRFRLNSAMLKLKRFIELDRSRVRHIDGEVDAAYANRLGVLDRP